MVISIAVAAIAMFVYLRDKFSIAIFDPQGIYNISQPLLLVRLFEQALWDNVTTHHLGWNIFTNKNYYQHNVAGIILEYSWFGMLTKKTHLLNIKYTKAGTLLLHDMHIHVTKVSEGIFNIMGEGIASDMFIDVNSGQF